MFLLRLQNSVLLLLSDLTKYKYGRQIILDMCLLNNGQFLSRAPFIIHHPDPSIFNPSAQFLQLVSCDLERN